MPSVDYAKAPDKAISIPVIFQYSLVLWSVPARRMVKMFQRKILQILPKSHLHERLQQKAERSHTLNRQILNISPASPCNVSTQLINKPINIFLITDLQLSF